MLYNASIKIKIRSILRSVTVLPFYLLLVCFGTFLTVFGTHNLFSMIDQVLVFEKARIKCTMDAIKTFRTEFYDSNF